MPLSPSRYGKTVRSPELKTHLMTGEFVRIEKCKGQSFLFRIVDVLDYSDLAAAEQAAWAGGHSCRADFVLAQWCSVVGDDDGLFPKSQMPLKERAACEGIPEIVLRWEFSWFPVESIRQVVVIWPMEDVTTKKVFVHGQPDHCCSGPVFQIYWAKRSPAAAILRCYSWRTGFGRTTNAVWETIFRSVDGPSAAPPTSASGAPTRARFCSPRTELLPRLERLVFDLRIATSSLLDTGPAARRARTFSSAAGSRSKSFCICLSTIAQQPPTTRRSDGLDSTRRGNPKV